MKTMASMGALALTAALSVTSFSAVAQPAKPECIAPAKPGGGFDLTCRLAQAALKDSQVLKDPLRISYMPGGIGAVAYNTIVTQRPAEGGTIVAYSGGSLLNSRKVSLANTTSMMCAGLPRLVPILV